MEERAKRLYVSKTMKEKEGKIWNGSRVSTGHS